jgi:hypothetical protein
MGNFIKKTIRTDNSMYMECVDELATQITEMKFGSDTYAESSEVGQENVMMFTEEAQDYYNEKYDEYDSDMNTKKITYDDTRDASIKVVEKLIDLGLLEDNDDHYFEVQDTIQDEFNELLQLDMDDNLEVKIKLKNKLVEFIKTYKNK